MWNNLYKEETMPQNSEDERDTKKLQQVIVALSILCLLFFTGYFLGERLGERRIMFANIALALQLTAMTVWAIEIRYRLRLWPFK